MTRQGRRFCSRSLSWIGNNNQAISCSKNNSKVVKLLASRVPPPLGRILAFHTEPAKQLRTAEG